MPKADFFRRLGIFALEGFLEIDLCNVIQMEMKLSQSFEPAQVTRDGADRVDEAMRRTKLVTVSDKTIRLIEQHLTEIKPSLESYFSIKLDDFEDLNFLAYKEEDFFKLHTDSDISNKAHTYVQKRRISIVLFLNSENSEFSTNNLDGYTGGALTLYGLIKQPHWENYGFTIQGEAGLLVAFPAEIYHEVTPVTQGMRFTMVTWFLSPALTPIVASQEFADIL